MNPIIRSCHLVIPFLIALSCNNGSAPASDPVMVHDTLSDSCDVVLIQDSADEACDTIVFDTLGKDVMLIGD